MHLHLTESKHNYDLKYLIWRTVTEHVISELKINPICRRSIALLFPERFIQTRDLTKLRVPSRTKRKPTEILNSCNSLTLLQLIYLLKLVRPQFQLLCRSMSSCHKHRFPVPRNVITNRYTSVLFITSCPDKLC
jgi:hypothetical protein